MSGFTNGLELLHSSSNEIISTGSNELDSLIGGIRRGMFYLFYGETELIEVLFRYLIANGLKSNEKCKYPVVVYILCSNYRKERTEIGTEELVELVEASGYGMEESLRRIHILTASSADQQALLINELTNVLEKKSEVNLVLINGIFKLHFDDARVRNRHVVREEVQRSITRFSQICAERGIPIVASGRTQKAKLIPKPESSSFLRHIANAIVYIRRRGRDTRFNRAFLLSHPGLPPSSIEYSFKVNEELGRDTPPFRQSFNELLTRLRREFQEALMSVKRRKAFDLLVDSWSAELGAVSYAETVKLLDLLFLVALVENRSISEDIQKRIVDLENRMTIFEDHLRQE